VWHVLPRFKSLKNLKTLKTLKTLKPSAAPSCKLLLWPFETAAQAPERRRRPCKLLLYEPRSKFIVYAKCVIKLVSPLSFYRASCFFMFWHIFFICLSIVLKCVHLDPHPWRSLFACVGGHLCFCPCLSLTWSSFPLLGRSLQSAGLLEQIGFGSFWHTLTTHSC